MVTPTPSSAHPVYVPSGDAFDEAIAADGTVRAMARATLDRVAADPRSFERHTAQNRDALGVVFNSYTGDVEFKIDPVPRIIDAAEWAHLEHALAQRVRALDSFCDDVYGAGAAITEGVIPERVVASAMHHDPGAADLRPPGGIWIGVAGLDLVRDPHGEMLVLEDNVRTPSGIAYAMAARDVVAPQFADLPPAEQPQPIDGALQMLSATLHDAAPDKAPANPLIVLLSDGPHNSAWWEHQLLSERLGMPLVVAADLQARGDHLYLATDVDTPIDVVYRRTDKADSASWVADLIGPALKAGTIGVVNGFGTGVADDKLVHAYVEDLIRFYLGEEPLIGSVKTFDLGQPDQLDEALDRVGELVVKPRGGAGGVGVVVCPHADPTEVEAARTAMVSDPAGHVAQEVVMLSTHPTVIDGSLRPRHVDLRPFIYLRADREAQVAPGGLSRVALGAGQLVVNSSQNGGAKDTWVVPR